MGIMNAQGDIPIKPIASDFLDEGKKHTPKVEDTQRLLQRFPEPAIVIHEETGTPQFGNGSDGTPIIRPLHTAQRQYGIFSFFRRKDIGL